MWFWSFLKWLGRGLWWIFKQAYRLPGLVGLFVIAAGREAQKSLVARIESGAVAYPILEYLLLIALGLIMAPFEAGWLIRASVELTQLGKDIVHSLARRRAFPKLAPRAAGATPWAFIVWKWLETWMFAPAWLPV